MVNNYENQFMGEQNDLQLKKWLFENDAFTCFIDPALTREIYQNFKGKEFLKYSHPISTLLTLSLFTKLKADGKV